MFFDNTLMIADALAYDGSPTAIDLGLPGADGYGVGPGEPVRLTVAGSPDLAGATGIEVLDGSTSTPTDALLELVTDLTGNTIEVKLPQSVGRYIVVNLLGSPSAGTWTCGITPEGSQSNR